MTIISLIKILEGVIFLFGFLGVVFWYLAVGIIKGLFERRERFEFEPIATAGFRSNDLNEEL